MLVHVSLSNPDVSACIFSNLDVSACIFEQP